MKNIVPEFIAQRSQLGEEEGKFSGVALFLDISGFTAITEELMKDGKLGAESLSQIINSLFSPLITAIYSQGGFVSLFAGDAFTAIFPDENGKPEQKSLNALKAAIHVQDIIKEQQVCRTRHGYFSLSLKVGLALGPIQWGILGNQEARQCFYFRGSAIELCALAEQQACQGDIVLEHSLLKHLGSSVKCKELSKEYFLLEQELAPTENEKSMKGLDLNPAKIPKISISNHILERFAPKDLLSTVQKGEFRDVASVFISYQGSPTKQELHDFINEIMKHCREMGAYFNSLDFGDKGCTALVFFGAPVAHEDDRVRSAHFSFKILGKFDAKVRIGICHGTVFAGFIGSELRTAYTALGNVVNLSARLMVAAPWGRIWILENLSSYLQSQEIFKIKLEGKEYFKGIAHPLKVYELHGIRKRSFVGFDQVDFVGREEEMQRVHKEFGKTLKEKKSTVIYYYGTPGSGKSRMLHEIYKQYKEDYEFHFIHADHVLQKSFHPFSRYLKNYLELPNEESEKALQILHTKVEYLSQQAASSSHLQKEALLGELKQKISYLGAILEIQTLKLKYHELGQQTFFSNIVTAVSALVKLYSLIRPLVLVVEDLHLLDKDSLCMLEDIANASPDFPLYVLISSRYTDEGAKPALKLKENVHSLVEVLDKLSESAVEKLVCSRLGGEAEFSLLRFIQEKTDANAFFIEQFCLYLQSEDLLIKNDKQIRLKKVSQNIPEGINALLLARIDRLSPNLRATVQLASVLGLYFNIKIFSELYKGDTVLRMEEGIREQIWEDCKNGEYKFKDNLLRLVAYEMQLRDPLRKIHLNAAKAIEKLFPRNSAYDSEIAFHYENAEEINLARQYYYNAATLAEEYYNLNKALEYYDKLINIARHDREKDALLEKKGEALYLSGKWDEAIALLLSLCKQSMEAGSKDKLARYLAKIGEIYQKRGNYPKAIKNLNQAMELSEEAKDLKTFGFASRLLGRTFGSMGKYAEAEQVLQKGLLADEESGDKQGMGMNLYYTGVLYREQSDYKKALECYHRSYEIFSISGDRFYFTYPLCELGILHSYRGDLEKAQGYFEQTEQIYAKAGYKSGCSAVMLNIGSLELRKGNFKEAVRFLEGSLSLAEEIGESMAIAYSLFNIGVLYYQRCNYKKALSYFKQSFTLMRSAKMRGYYGYIFSYLSCLFGRSHLLLRTYRVALQHFQNIKNLGGSDVENGRTHLGMALALTKQESQTAPLPKIIQEISKLSGLEATADTYYKAAIQKAQNTNYVNTLIPALYEYAFYLYEKGLKEKARALLRESEDHSQRSGMLLEIKTIKKRKAKIK